MSDENDKPNENDKPSPPSDTPKPDTPPEAPPEPPTPPTPKPDDSPVTRHEFNGVVDSIGKLTESVGALVDRLSNTTPNNTKPTKPPWTHLGSRRNDNE